ncbi:hypothetical protein WR25_03352 [Diploscapter pachys]|uniref:TPM domain-containing protein n=1 Tax=Diploscapter pachys TaxID=2018661 RepID=A0A2A2L3V5_9BILA|nr:hypothetical protein WR25_03352 [Diploscapter pachys]
MKPTIHIEWLAFSALISFQLSFAKDWSANDYPNPVIDFQKCGMKTSSYICDPDNILSESDRYRLNHELQQLETRTRQDNHPDFCQKKGVTAGIALARKVKGHNQDSVKAMGDRFINSWMLDPDCKKSVVLVMAVDDRKLWSARDERMPLRDPEIQEIIAKAAPHFKNKQITQGLLGIVRDIWEKTLSKKPQPAPRPTQRPQPQPKPQPVQPVQNVPQNPQQSSQNNYNQNNYDSTSSKSEGLGWKTWLVIILIVIALLSICCCCLVYYKCKQMLCGCCEDGGSSHRGGGSSQNVYHHHYHHNKGDGHHTSGGVTSNTIANEQNTNLITNDNEDTSNENKDSFYPDVNEKSSGVGVSWGDADDDKGNDNQDTGDDTNDKGNDEGNNDTSNDNKDSYYPDVNEKSSGTGMSW